MRTIDEEDDLRFDVSQEVARLPWLWSKGLQTGRDGFLSIFRMQLGYTGYAVTMEESTLLLPKAWTQGSIEEQVLRLIGHVSVAKKSKMQPALKQKAQLKSS